jgi:hypothetical protein
MIDETYLEEFYRWFTKKMIHHITGQWFCITPIYSKPEEVTLLHLCNPSGLWEMKTVGTGRHAHKVTKAYLSGELNDDYKCRKCGSKPTEEELQDIVGMNKKIRIVAGLTRFPAL